ncbi:thioesterase II family protein [Candidatus Leptofilum sp.]|uniref:thioesterase II family protein n=1 Tax=Candidatus Leptofilum sp. TaxID=3241576 RepID=UPI003B5C9E5B
MVESPWIAYAKPNEQAALRLFCLPHAGGGAGTYRTWVDWLAPDIEVLPVQLPGRETRFLERPYQTIESLLDDLTTAIRPLLNKPFAFFGHSLGALVGFELARRLRQDGVVPRQLFVSGYGAPHLLVKLPPMHHLDDVAFVAALRELDTVPTAVLENEELLGLLLPMLRADFAVYEGYIYYKEPPLSCPIIILGGEADPLVPAENLAAWATHTTQPGEMHLIPGGHFYLQGQETAVLQIIRQSLQVQQPS